MKHSILSLFVCALLCGFSADVSGTHHVTGRAYKELKRRILEINDLYDPTEGNEPVEVTLRVMLIDIVSADKSNNQMEFVAWTPFIWTDKNLQWDASLTNVTSLRFKAKEFWTPDVVIYSQTAPADLIYSDIDLSVNNRGKVLYNPSRIFRVPCDVTNVDSQEGAECTFTFSSWEHSEDYLNLMFAEGMDKVDLEDFFQGSKYEVIGNTAVRKEKHYDCCPETFIQLEYKLTIRSKMQ